ncbi:hypothetical protein AGR3A_Lc40011 [Agrobacterium tomkonis CFBP 6623]|uniref:Uncharacterized protein n=1 Tax=Agrobacterium tomkonis CFBP 6623 TaxID=1183432 RepID=A0A1S7S485_9HYPH|nr:hypothetical protein AGR3A_Lc40011 [Agrobacterium tomkonis CFBP 6623]
MWILGSSPRVTLSVEKMALFTYPREQLPDRPGTQFFYHLLTQCMHVMLLRYISKNNVAVSRIVFRSPAWPP